VTPALHTPRKWVPVTNQSPSVIPGGAACLAGRRAADRQCEGGRSWPAVALLRGALCSRRWNEFGGFLVTQRCWRCNHKKRSDGPAMSAEFFGSDCFINPRCGVSSFRLCGACAALSSRKRARRRKCCSARVGNGIAIRWRRPRPPHPPCRFGPPGILVALGSRDLARRRRRDSRRRVPRNDVVPETSAGRSIGPSSAWRLWLVPRPGAFLYAPRAFPTIIALPAPSIRRALVPKFRLGCHRCRPTFTGLGESAFLKLVPGAGKRRPDHLCRCVHLRFNIRVLALALIILHLRFRGVREAGRFLGHHILCRWACAGSLYSDRRAHMPGR